MAEIPHDTQVDGRYVILGRIGAGGMAEVYRARDTHLGREVALKLLYRHFAEDAEFVERFRREASAAAGLQHPNVVNVYDRGEWDGTYYIAMEYLPGRSLKELIRAEAPLAPARAIGIALQVLRAARFAHRHGVIHRDLKPHNVIVDDEGRAKVTDFGIARAGASDMTQTGSIMGTAQYLSPEQAQGRAVSAQSDIYAVGIVLYEMLTGRVPFDGESAVAIALKQVGEQPAPPGAYNGAVTPELERVVLRALEKDPALRFAGAGEFMAALERAREGLAPGGPATQSTAEIAAFGAADAAGAAPPSDPPPTPLAEGAYAPFEPPGAGAGGDEGAERPPGGGRRWPWIALALALLAIGGGIAAYLLTRPERVVVPHVTGERTAIAVKTLTKAGLGVDRKRAYSKRARGVVIDQTPAGGAQADAGATVLITISRGQKSAAIPDVSGIGRRQAKRILARAGFRPALSGEPSDTVPRGEVISTTPPAGVRYRLGQSIKVVYSTGVEKVAVPSLVGKSGDEAASLLDGAGLEVGGTREREQKGEEPGTVLAQSPSAGTEVPKGTSVDLTLAKEADRKVPDVTGRDSSTATNALSHADLKVTVVPVKVSAEDQDGIVQSQHPKGGAEVPPRTEVEIVVGEYKAPSEPGGGGGTDTTGTTGTTTTPGPGAGVPGQPDTGMAGPGG